MNKAQEYLKEHGINQASAVKFELSGDDLKLNIPVKDADGKLIFVKERRFYGDIKFFIPKGKKTILFNSDLLKQNLDYLVITAGEIDCIRADHEGIPAVSSTGGEGTFSDDWVSQILAAKVENIYLCEDNDGNNGPKLAKRIAAKFPKIKIIHFPAGVKDTCEFFKFHTKADFIKLMEEAEEFIPEQKKEKTKFKPDLTKLRFFHPALTIDRDNQEVMLGIPKPIPGFDDKGRYQLTEVIKIVSNKEKNWDLVQVEIEARNLFPKSIPSFGATESTWSDEDMVSYQNEAKSDQDDHTDHHLGGNPYKEVFLPIKEVFDRFIDFYNPDYSTLLTLWIMGSYIFTIFEAYPYIHLTGGPGTGKSKVLEILCYLAFNAIACANASPSSLFRSVESSLATIVLDEGETLTGREVNPDLRLLFNSGYKQTGSVIRTNPETLKVDHFTTYSPKAIASINPLDSTTASRCIQIIMLKTANKLKGKLKINERALNKKVLKNSLYRWCLDHALGVAKIFDKENLSDLNNRSNELFSPLFAIASYLDEYIPESETKILPVMQKLAEECIEEEDLLDDWSLWVLQAIDEVVIDFRPYQVKDVRMAILRGRVAASEVLDEKMSHRWIGSCLKKFGFKRGKPTEQGKTYLLKREHIESLKERYGLIPPTPDSTVSMVSTDSFEAKNTPDHNGDSKTKGSDTLSKSNSETQTDKPDGCYLCKGTSFYKNPSGVLTCSRCHPSSVRESSD